MVHNDADWASLPLVDFDNIVIAPGPGRPDRKRDFGISARRSRTARSRCSGCAWGTRACVTCSVAASVWRRYRCTAGSRRSGIPGPASSKVFPSPFPAGALPLAHRRLHASELEEQAWTEDGLVMAAGHRTHPLWGVQFHPESICTRYGRELLGNFRDLTPSRSGRRPTRPATPAAADTPSEAAGPQPRYHVSSTPDRPGGRSARGVRSLSRTDRTASGSTAAPRWSPSRSLGDGRLFGTARRVHHYRVAETTVRVQRQGRPDELLHRRFSTTSTSSSASARCRRTRSCRSPSGSATSATSGTNSRPTPAASWSTPPRLRTLRSCSRTARW